ncbi:MAG: class I SAM-dependent methyltransferase, partial [Ktedonobacterales bacterium]
WYTAYYREEYAASVAAALTAERSAAEVAFILRETGAQPPAAVADVACGHGRHARILAERGFAVTSVDQNAVYLERARADLPAGASARFIQGDMRAAVGGPYTLVLSLFHSFGFFADEENRGMLQSWAGVLAPGGFFALDVWNRDALLRRDSSGRTWQAAPDLSVAERYAYDPLSGRSTIHYTYTYGDGRTREYEASFRLYTPPELRSMFATVGLTVTALYGSLTGDAYRLDAPRTVLFARKD